MARADEALPPAFGHVGPVLRWLREARFIEPWELARMTGIRVRRLRAIERGLARPLRRELSLILYSLEVDFLGLSMAQMMLSCRRGSLEQRVLEAILRGEEDYCLEQLAVLGSLFGALPWTRWEGRPGG